ncbi:hypothetical protein FRC01_004288 [Tulasnella sp. 417]|nr:hypothetical protein FRC01_004288 [Tulasnella sp. 417]
MSGPMVSNCDPDEVKFLYDVLDNLKAVIEDTTGDQSTRTELKEMESVLSDALERLQWSSDGKGLHESQNLSEREGDIRDSHQSANGPRGEEWNFERLCKRILNQVQATGLECQAIIRKLEARCGIADAVTANGTAIQARPYNSPLGKEAESRFNSCYISLLPVEVLQQIFRSVASPHNWVQAPLVLSHVNSYFRAIFLDTPSLWVALDESLSFPLLNLYVARSKSEPLDILTRIDRLFDESAGLEDRWIHFLKTESSRVGQMKMASCIPDNLTEWGRRLRPLVFTSVAELTVCSMDSTDDVSACPIWVCFPLLRQLSIERGWCLGWVGHDDPFPPSLRSLTFTKISEVYPSTLLEALGGVLDLVRLVLEDFALNPDDIEGRPAPSPVTLTCLEELELKNVTVADIEAISLLVATPNLSSLSITIPDSSDGGLDFLTTFTAKHPRLSSLGIFGLKLVSQELEMMLHKLPNLTHLHIHGADLTEDHAAFLKSETTPFPRLSLIVS